MRTYCTLPFSVLHQDKLLNVLNFLRITDSREAAFRIIRDHLTFSDHDKKVSPKFYGQNFCKKWKPRYFFRLQFCRHQPTQMIPVVRLGDCLSLKNSEKLIQNICSHPRQGQAPRKCKDPSKFPVLLEPNKYLCAVVYEVSSNFVAIFLKMTNHKVFRA